jgi:Killing trait
MAFPTSINSQITDSISQVNTKVLGDSPAMAMGNLFVATGQALSNAAHNATNAQQQSYVTVQAATTQAVGTLLSVDTSSTGISTTDIFTSRRGY